MLDKVKTKDAVTNEPVFNEPVNEEAASRLSHYGLRTDLAAALRWAARHELHEGVDNHFSIAVADENDEIRGDRFLINPYGWHWSEITATSLVLCDADGKVLEGDEYVEDTAFYIHSRIHVNVPGANVVLHNHQPYTTALTLLEDGRLKMCEQNALSFHNRVAYDNAYNGLALDQSEGDRLAGLMAGATVLMMAGHGVTVVGPTMQDAFNDLYYLERAAMFQVLARSTGQPLMTIPDHVIDKTAEQQLKSTREVADRHFRAIKRILAKEEPEYLS